MAKKKPKGAASGAKPAIDGPSRPSEESKPSEDWRCAMLSEIRGLIQEADPKIVEERKWVKPTNPAGVPVWSHAGIVCTGETYKQVVKVTFFKGAALDDPQGLFNSSLEGNARRAIDLREGETLDAGAFKAMIQAAVAENIRAGIPKSRVRKSRAQAERD
ncbi:MAG: DUF1801 domain-containing protein [Planctomycetaceae bacterium]|nr:DUF1801 domain-containing protein [Planctomycetaceae bacterium]